MVWRPTELTAMLGVTARRRRARRCSARTPCAPSARPARPASTTRRGPITREILTNSQALLAFLALMNCDVIVARNILEGHDAGLYAGGLILTKAMLFLPQFVVVVAFPAMSTAHERRGALLRSLTLVLGLGVVGVLGCALLPRLALIFVGGQEYAEIDDRLWLFAVLGTVLSLLQLLIYAVLARQGTRSVWLVWGALAAVLAIGSQLAPSTPCCSSWPASTPCCS